MISKWKIEFPLTRRNTKSEKLTSFSEKKPRASSTKKKLFMKLLIRIIRLKFILEMKTTSRKRKKIKTKIKMSKMINRIKMRSMRKKHSKKNLNKQAQALGSLTS